MKDTILKVTLDLIQNKGFNGFSYKDISEKIGIKNSSIHYYFPSKKDITIAVVEFHLNELKHAIKSIENSDSNYTKKLMKFINLMLDLTLESDNKMCLGAILACNLKNLPEEVINSVKSFFYYLENWLKKIIYDGSLSFEFSKNLNPLEEAQSIIMLLEGTLLLSRLDQDKNRLVILKRNIIRNLT